MTDNDLGLIQVMLRYEIHDEQTTPDSQKLLQHDCFIVKETAEAYMSCFHRWRGKGAYAIGERIPVSEGIHHQ